MQNISTKQKILAAAKTLFVEHGFAGTSIGNIAKLAKINHSLVFHHFKNKANLWHEVKLDILGSANIKSKIIPSTDLPFELFLSKIVKNSIDFYQNNPDIMRMIQWQRLEHSTEHDIGIRKSSELQAWIDAFKHYQEKGALSKKYKAEYIVKFILTITSTTVLDKDSTFQGKKEQSTYIEFCSAMITKALL